MLACDATRIPLLTDGTRLLATGDAHTPISLPLRRAILARDQGCRFPGCTSPTAHADLHHVTHREARRTNQHQPIWLRCAGRITGWSTSTTGHSPSPPTAS